MNYQRFKPDEQPPPPPPPNQSNVQTGRHRPILVIISGTIALLLLAAALAFVGTITIIKSKHSTTGSDHNIIRPTKAIKKVCDATLYPNLCVNSLVRFPGAMGANTSYELVHISVNMTLQRFWQALDLSTEIGNLEFGGSFEKAAYEDCVELLQDSVELLTQSLFTIPPADSSADNNQGGSTTEDVLTWLSASLANQDTCTDGLLKSSGTLTDQLHNKLKDLSELVSNCLALISNFNNKDLVGASIDNGRRRLLALSNEPDESGFPAWLSRRDRELLASAPVPGTGIGVQADVVVAADGSGTVKTIAEAIKKAPEHSKTRFIIFLKAGRYEEDNLKVGLRKTNVWIIGEGKGKTIVTGRTSVGRDKVTTFHTASFAATGSGFVAKGITFTNEAGPGNDQAVALRVGADHAAIYQCQIIGYQDTLYVHSNRQFYRECDVYGTVDFIFGNAAVVFQSCNLFARKPLPMQKNTVTAQKRKDPNDISGISIHKCWIKATPDLESVKDSYPTYLGRPWKPLSRVVVMLSFIGDHVDPKGWLEWNATAPVNLLYYGEYKNYGPRADVSQRVKWPGLHLGMSEADASLFTVDKFIYGSSWLVSTQPKPPLQLTDFASSIHAYTAEKTNQTPMAAAYSRVFLAAVFALIAVSAFAQQSPVSAPSQAPTASPISAPTGSVSSPSTAPTAMTPSGSPVAGGPGGSIADTPAAGAPGAANGAVSLNRVAIGSVAVVALATAFLF